MTSSFSNSCNNNPSPPRPSETLKKHVSSIKNQQRFLESSRKSNAGEFITRRFETFTWTVETKRQGVNGSRTQMEREGRYSDMVLIFA